MKLTILALFALVTIAGACSNVNEVCGIPALNNLRDYLTTVDNRLCLNSADVTGCYATCVARTTCTGKVESRRLAESNSITGMTAAIAACKNFCGVDDMSTETEAELCLSLSCFAPCMFKEMDLRAPKSILNPRDHAFSEPLCQTLKSINSIIVDKPELSDSFPFACRRLFRAKFCPA